MKFSLFPEKPLLLYPSLAATIGLEESILAGVLLEVSKNLPTLINNGFEWAQIDADQLREALPFWNDVDIARISTSLRQSATPSCQFAPVSWAGVQELHRAKLAAR